MRFQTSNETQFLPDVLNVSVDTTSHVLIGRFDKVWWVASKLHCLLSTALSKVDACGHRSIVHTCNHVSNYVRTCPSSAEFVYMR